MTGASPLGPPDEEEEERFEAGRPAEVVPPLSAPARRLAAVVWPAFLTAAVLEMLVFAMVDPRDLHWLRGAAVVADDRAVYTIAFFVFWAVAAFGGALTQMVLDGAGPDSRLDRGAR